MHMFILLKVYVKRFQIIIVVKARNKNHSNYKTKQEVKYLNKLST